MKVRDVMTRQPRCCIPDDTLETAARRMVECDCGALPVIGELDRIPVGIITDRDIVVRAVAAQQGTQHRVRDCMTTPAITVTEQTDLDECIELLERAQIRRMIVVDDRGRCTGIVAQADVAGHTSKRRTGELLRCVSRPSTSGDPAFARS
jgi:CBS domain-containing protein